MKTLWIGIIGLAAATTANAAAVVYTLSLNNDGFSGPGATPGSFAIFADVSQGDNGGLFAFSMDLVDGSVDSIVNMAPNWLYRNSPPTSQGPTKFVGFGTGIAEDELSGRISGATDLSKGNALLPVYGFGQRNFDMNAVPPNGPRPSIGGVQYNRSMDENPNAPGPLVAAHMLLGTGAFSTHVPAWQVGSADNTASVYDDCTGTENVAVIPILLTEEFAAGAPILQQLGSSSAAAASCAAIPEPAMMGIFALTAMGLRMRPRK